MKIKIKEMKKKISIIVTAYKTQDFIEECLDSIEKQTYFDDYNGYEILVGVDGCKETLEKLKEIRGKYRNLRIFMMNSNKGTYVTSNTLITLANYDTILRFDSDDIMLTTFIREFTNYIDDFDIVRSQFYYYKNSKILGIEQTSSKGVMMFKKELFNKMGGFVPWKCSGDFEFQRRASTISTTKEIKKPLFLYRLHKNALTKNNETGMHTNFRREINRKINSNYKKIELITNSYKEIVQKQIPKIIHQIWIGPKNPPECMKDWKRLNPDYDYILWDNEKVKNFKLKNKKQFDLLKEDYAGKSDVLRYEILKKHGGIYFDADCVPLRPLEDSLLKTDFFTCYLNEKERPGRLASGIIGCLKNDSIILKCIDEISKISKIDRAAFLLVGPVLFTRVYNDFKKGKIHPSYYFLPEFFNGEKYNGDFKPFCSHFWGTTKNLYK